MSALPPKSPATAAPFSDAFGYRVLGFDKKSGDRLEMLRLRPQLASSAPFEAALRERQRRLSDFRHPAFARVRQIDRPAGQSAALAVVSNHFEGLRLSDLLKIVEGNGLRLDLASALCLMRQATAAIGRLHECGEDISHGALNPERVVVGANGRLIVTEYVLGAGLDALALSRQQAWQDFRVALPSAAAPARLDHAADIFQLGYLGLTLVSGRSLFDRQYPIAFADRLAAAEEIQLEGGPQTLHPSVRGWLSRALWLETVPFSSAAEAQAALEEAIAVAGLVAGPDAVIDLVERCYGASPDSRPREATTESTIVGQPAPSADRVEARAPEPRAEAPAAWTPPAPVSVEPARSLPPEVETTSQTTAMPEPEIDQAAAAVAALLVDAQTAARVDPTPVPEGSARPEPHPAVEPAPEPELAKNPEPADSAPELPAARAWNPQARPERPRPDPAAARAETPRPEAAGAAMFARYGEAAEAPVETAPTKSSVRRPYLVALGMAVVMVAVFEVGIRYMNPFGGTPAKAISASELPAAHGTLTIDATPKAQVFIDDAAKGETPLKLDLPAGQHNVRLEAEGGASRTLVVNVIGGKEISQLVEMGRAAVTTGTVDVKSEPAGARVTFDGKLIGVSPIVVPDVKPGSHSIVVEGPNGAIRQVVQVAAGATASVFVPLSSVPANVPTGGWLTVEATEEMHIYEGGRLLGTSRTDRIMLPAGSHDLELRNDAVGFTTTRSVQVLGGKVARISVQLPDGSLSLNATPWAEVFVDGQRIGETPVGNVAVRAGTHEIVFRHPQHGEVRQTVVVKAGEAGRVTVNMAK